jgi:hypothetical protein
MNRAGHSPLAIGGGSDGIGAFFRVGKTKDYKRKGPTEPTSIPDA